MRDGGKECDVQSDRARRGCRSTRQPHCALRFAAKERTLVNTILAVAKPYPAINRHGQKSDFKICPSWSGLEAKKVNSGERILQEPLQSPCWMH